MIRIICLLLLSITAKAQYFVGDQLQDIQLGQTLYQKNQIVSLNDHAGTFLVLDIMSLSCRSCIDALPKYDSIQQQLGRDAQILILVNSSKEKAEEFFKKRGLDKLKQLRFIAMSEEAKSSFNILSYPFHVWVGKDGIVKAITGAEYLSLQNIRSVAASDRITTWPDISVPPDEPLVDISRIDNSNKFTGYYTLFQSYRNGFRHMQELTVDTVNNFQQWNLYNLSIPALYKIAIKGLTDEDLTGERWSIMVKDSSRFFHDKTKEYKAAWQRKNHFSIEYVLPLQTKPEQRHTKLLHDLNFYLGLNGRIEKKEMPCRVIRYKKDIQASTSNKNSLTLKEVIHHINTDGRFGIFILDEAVDKNLKIEANALQLKTPEGILQLLEANHLSVAESKRIMEYFVLSEQ